MNKEQLKELKAKYGEVFHITLKKRGSKEQKEIYLRPPTVDDVKNAMAAMQRPTDNIAMALSLLSNTFLGEARERLEIENDPKYLLGLVPILSELTDPAEATLKKV